MIRANEVAGPATTLGYSHPPVTTDLVKRSDDIVRTPNDERLDTRNVFGEEIARRGKLISTADHQPLPMGDTLELLRPHGRIRIRVCR